MQVDKIALIYVRNKKVLAALSKGKNLFYMPGGKREKGETDLQTLTREIKEELSVNIIPSCVQFYGTFEAASYTNQEDVTAKLTCYTGNFTGKSKPSSEVKRFEWLTSNDMDRVPPTGKLILAYLKRKSLIE